MLLYICMGNFNINILTQTDRAAYLLFNIASLFQANYRLIDLRNIRLRVYSQSDYGLMVEVQDSSICDVISISDRNS